MKTTEEIKERLKHLELSKNELFEICKKISPETAKQSIDDQVNLITYGFIGSEISILKWVLNG